MVIETKIFTQENDWFNTHTFLISSDPGTSNQLLDEGAAAALVHAFSRETLL